jgi:hypothetical protein
MKTTASADHATRDNVDGVLGVRRGSAAELRHQGADDHQHRQRGDDHQRLRLRVVAGEGQRGEVDDRARGERQRHRRFAPLHPPGDRREERQDGDRAHQARQRRAADRVEAVVGGGPDP